MVLLVVYVFWGLLAMPLPWEFQRAGFAVQLLICKSRHLIYFRLASQCWCGGSRPPTLVHPDSDHVSCWSLLALVAATGASDWVTTISGLLLFYF